MGIGEEKYYIKDLEEGTGTFVRIKDQAGLRNGNIISFGDNHVVFGV
jgi:pSer/pThr/pTyr-binding forkhead associated (FHA) protein